MRHLGREYNHGGVIEDNYSDGNGIIHVRQQVDLSNLFESNNDDKKYGNNGFTKEGDMRKIAEIDMLTVYKLKTELNIDVFNNDDLPRLKKWLKENNKFMTVNGGI